MNRRCYAIAIAIVIIAIAIAIVLRANLSSVSEQELLSLSKLGKSGRRVGMWKDFEPSFMVFCSKQVTLGGLNSRSVD
ncbi:MAG: hypothetical protein IPP51_18080 [Bacteroidetes bacterium]|nr:hypothetical protein [Bacteroidota bacterium]